MASLPQPEPDQPHPAAQWGQAASDQAVLEHSSVGARPPRRQATLVCAFVALALAAAELLGGAWLWYLTETDTSDDPLVGIGYLFAVVAAAPGLIGVLLAVPALLLARRSSGLVCAVLALVATALPAVWGVGLFLPGPIL